MVLECGRGDLKKFRSLAAFGAARMEMVEAVTIVVAVGATRGWREAWAGAPAAVALLGAVVAIGGIPLIRFVPLDTLRIGVGIVALDIGATWLKP